IWWKCSRPVSDMDTAKNQSSRGRATKLWLRRGVLLLLAAMGVGAIVLAALPQPVLVETAMVDKGPLIVTVDEDGVARVKDRYIVSAPLSGNLGRIQLDAGDVVEQGEVLAQILPLRAPLLDARSRDQAQAQVARAIAAERQADAQVERARAANEFATAEALRTKHLFEKNAISQTEL